MFISSPNNYAYSTSQWGNTGRYIIPLSSASAALILKDYQGIAQMALASGIVLGTTEGLKFVTHERRPNGSCCSSFPSGHTSAAFTGASFIHFRYGFKYSIPFYLSSLFVAYTRVKNQSHHAHDAVCGAALAITGTYLSTTRYKENKFSIAVDRKYAGIIYRKLFY